MKHNRPENDDSPTGRALQSALDAIEKHFGPGAIATGVQKTPVMHQRDEAIAEIARLAKIPTINSERFCGTVWNIFLGAEQTAGFLAAARELDDGSLRKAEAAIRSAYDAVRALKAPQRSLFEKAFLVAGGCRELLNEDVAPGTLGLGVLEALVAAFASLTNKSPSFEPRSGAKRPRGTIGRWPFREVVGFLWQTVNKYGGELTFSCKGNRGSGTMIDALKILRPVLPPGLIPSELPAKSIDQVKKTLKVKTYFGFNFMQSAGTL
jgi:hypothetical protein